MAVFIEDSGLLFNRSEGGDCSFVMRTVERTFKSGECVPSWLVGGTVLRYYSREANLNVAIPRIKYIEMGKCSLARNVPCWEEICVLSGCWLLYSLTAN